MKPMFSITEAESLMKEALLEAGRALEEDEVPVGCVIADTSARIIARSRNTRESSLSIHGHAEINAINSAAAATGSLNLSGLALFVTLEPCPMCAAAIAASGIDAVYFGAPAVFPGARPDVIKVLPSSLPYECYRGIMEKECGELVSGFFAKKRGV
ncbi:MAG: nucleoside deaminase [Clostridia bacterium]|nr:nucleoside deaminase [Clostridia bacterium]